MAFEAKVFRVLIASPSDVIEEREIAVRTIQEWNDLHSHERQIVLLPLRWESHSAPEYGRRPQEVINKQIVDDCDFLVGVFWSKIGSPTGVKESGTIEEISRVASASKPVMLYFSNAKKDLEDIDLDQLAKLRDFKKQTYPNALVENYTTQVEFRDKLSKHLEMQIRQLISSGKDGALIKGLLSEIELSWFDLEKQKKNGKSCNFSTASFEILNRNNIPDYELEESDGDINWFGDRTNKNYFRDLADFFVTDNLLKPIQLCLENKGSLGARDLYISIRFTGEKGDLVVLSGAGFDSQKPQTKNDHLLWTGQKSFEIFKDSNTYTLSYELNALQPKRSVQTDLILYVGTTESSKVTVEATIYADSLPEPVKQELELNFSVKKESVEARELLQRLSKKRKAQT